MSNVPHTAAQIDRLIHEPSRTILMALLYGADEADFLYLLTESGLSKGNLSSHLQKLEKGGYVEIEKKFVGKIPRTVCRLTERGREAFRSYRTHIKVIAEQLG